MRRTHSVSEHEESAAVAAAASSEAQKMSFDVSELQQRAQSAQSSGPPPHATSDRQSRGRSRARHPHVDASSSALDSGSSGGGAPAEARLRPTMMSCRDATGGVGGSSSTVHALTESSAPTSGPTPLSEPSAHASGHLGSDGSDMTTSTSDASEGTSHGAAARPHLHGAARLHGISGGAGVAAVRSTSLEHRARLAVGPGRRHSVAEAPAAAGAAALGPTAAARVDRTKQLLINTELRDYSLGANGGSSSSSKSKSRSGGEGGSGGGDSGYLQDRGSGASSALSGGIMSPPSCLISATGMAPHSRAAPTANREDVVATGSVPAHAVGRVESTSARKFDERHGAERRQRRPLSHPSPLRPRPSLLSPQSGQSRSFSSDAAAAPSGRRNTLQGAAPRGGQMCGRPTINADADAETLIVAVLAPHPAGSSAGARRLQHHQPPNSNPTSTESTRSSDLSSRTNARLKNFSVQGSGTLSLCSPGAQLHSNHHEDASVASSQSTGISLSGHAQSATIGAGGMSSDSVFPALARFGASERCHFGLLSHHHALWSVLCSSSGSGEAASPTVRLPQFRRTEALQRRYGTAIGIGATAATSAAPPHQLFLRRRPGGGNANNEDAPSGSISSGECRPKSSSGDEGGSTTTSTSTSGGHHANDSNRGTSHATTTTTASNDEDSASSDARPAAYDGCEYGSGDGSGGGGGGGGGSGGGETTLSSSRQMLFSIPPQSGSEGASNGSASDSNSNLRLTGRRGGGDAPLIEPAVRGSSGAVGAPSHELLRGREGACGGGGGGGGGVSTPQHLALPATRSQRHAQLQRERNANVREWQQHGIAAWGGGAGAGHSSNNNSGGGGGSSIDIVDVVDAEPILVPAGFEHTAYAPLTAGGSGIGNTNKSLSLP